MNPDFLVKTCDFLILVFFLFAATTSDKKKKGWRSKRRVGGGSTSTSASSTAGASSSNLEPDSRSVTISKYFGLFFIGVLYILDNRILMQFAK